MENPSNNAVAVIAFSSVLGLALLFGLLKTKKTTIPSVPSWIPFLGSSLEFSKNPVGFLRKCHAKFGSIFNVYLGGKTMTFFVAPKHYSTLLKHKALSHLPVFVDISKKALDESEAYANYSNAVSPDALSKDYHKLYIPHLLNGSAVADLVARTFQKQRQVLAQIESNGRISLLDFVQKSIFESGTRVLMGDNLVDKSPNLWADFAAFDASFPLFVAGVPSYFLKPAVTARKNLVHSLNSFTGDDAAMLIQKRLELTLQFPSDKVGPLDAAKDSMALLWAASANSIPTAFWTLYYLLRDPGAWKSVQDEVLLHLDSAEQWTSEQLNRCVLLASAVDEALRLSASSLLMRVATEDVELQLDNTQIHLSSGSNVVIFPSLAHFDADIFPSPTSYQYDRFVEATKAQAEAFKPFGMGATMCPGRNFAKNQVKMFVALLMHDMNTFQLVDGFDEPSHDPSRLGLGILPPKNSKIQVDYVKRSKK